VTSSTQLAPAAPPARRLPGPLTRGTAFAAITGVFVLFLAASAAPSPLYVVYQQEWRFSATTLTGVFAIYVLGLLGSLLVFGALSDHVGRRPVLGAAVALEAVALLVFLVAGGVPALAVARLLQGIATGAAMTALSATLVDLAPPHAPGRAGVVNSVAPTGALAFGALACGALVQFAPSPTHLVFALLLAGTILAALVVGLMPETSARRPGARSSLRPRVSVPPRLRGDVSALVPIIVASWALGGLYLSLGPSVAAGLFDLRNHLVGGLVVTLLCGTGAVTAYVLRAWPAHRLLTVAAALLAGGMALTLAGIEAEVAVLAAAGTVLAGIGFGASALGSFGTLGAVAAPEERGELFAVAFVIAYLAFSIPAVLAGLATTSYGLHPTVVVYGAAVVLLCLAALFLQSRISRPAPAGRRRS
jgi:MFS family permease